MEDRLLDQPLKRNRSALSQIERMRPANKQSSNKQSYIYIYIYIYQHCGFGVRIAPPMYPPACPKRRLNGGWVRCNLVVKFTAIRLLQGPRFKPWLWQISELRFLLYAHPYSASGTTISGNRASPKPGI